MTSRFDVVLVFVGYIGGGACDVLEIKLLLELGGGVPRTAVVICSPDGPGRKHQVRYPVIHRVPW
jgi:hypothetical protein